MKPVTVAECDPELDAALEALHFVVPNYRAARAKFLAIHSDPERYRHLGAIKHEVTDLRDQIRTHAERCNLHVDALVHVVEQAAPLTKYIKGKRKSPAVNALLANLSTIEGYAAKADQEAREEFAFAEFNARHSARNLTVLGAAREYLEASRG